MQLCLITVGKLKEPALRALRDEYVKRLGRFCRLEEVELPDLPEPAAPSPAPGKASDAPGGGKHPAAHPPGGTTWWR